MAGCTRIIGGVAVKAVKGDLTKIRADALVNPANSLLVMGGGVAGALKRAGGEEIEQEAIRQAPVPVGQAVVTAAGRLPARYVIHAPTMERPAMRTSAEKVFRATTAALRMAEGLGIDTVAFPGMGTGVGGVSPLEAAETMLEAIKRHLEKGSRLKQILLVAYTDELLEAFCQALGA